VQKQEQQGQQQLAVMLLRMKVTAFVRSSALRMLLACMRKNTGRSRKSSRSMAAAACTASTGVQNIA
jgi:hypothetical protein